MPIFKCSRCNCIDNTALTNYWTREYDEYMKKRTEPMRPLCSECDPYIRKWHGKFERRPAHGYLLGEDGFLYSPTEYAAGRVESKIIGTVAEDGSIRPMPKRKS